MLLSRFATRLLTLALCAFGLAMEASAVTVSQSQLSRGPSDDSCNPPASVTGFQTLDQEIWAYFLIDDGRASDVPVVEWLGPDGQVAFADKFTVLPSAGSYCFDSYYSTAKDFHVPAPGNWTVRLRWNGLIVASIPFKVTAGDGPPDLPGCVSGPVDSVTFSLALKTAGLADEVIIGGTTLCPKCSVQPPVYPEFVAKLEDARETGVLVDACYDASGAVNQLRLRPPAR